MRARDAAAPPFALIPVDPLQAEPPWGAKGSATLNLFQSSVTLSELAAMVRATLAADPVYSRNRADLPKLINHPKRIPERRELDRFLDK